MQVQRRLAIGQRAECDTHVFLRAVGSQLCVVQIQTIVRNTV